MDARTDTSSGRFGGQWAFLSNPPLHHNHTRSLPPSSYLPRSDRSVISPIPPGYNFNASRSSLYRNYPPASIGGYSSATIPSRPVLIPVHSAHASMHAAPLPRGPVRRPIMSKNKELPSVSDFSIQRILAAIQEDIEGDIDAISEILGRSRLTLADQHDSHMPPQGEIRAVRPLQGIEEASSSNERLAGDDVVILREDASLVEGSIAGSAAYGLLERLQAVPRIRHQLSDAPDLTSGVRRRPPRTHSSPALLPEPSVSSQSVQERPRLRSPRAPRLLMQSETGQTSATTPTVRTTQPVVSETYLSAGADGRTATNPPIVSEAGRHYPLYNYDESELFEATLEPVSPGKLRNFQTRLQNLIMVNDLFGLTSWLRHEEEVGGGSLQTAESRLREILEQQREPEGVGPSLEPQEDEEMYD